MIVRRASCACGVVCMKAEISTPWFVRLRHPIDYLLAQLVEETKTVVMTAVNQASVMALRVQGHVRELEVRAPMLDLILFVKKRRFFTDLKSLR